jgi:hypothetical protein
VFNKDVKVPLQEAELVGTSSSNIYFKLAKTLDALDVVQGTAEDKVVGVRRGTRQSPKQGRWPSTVMSMKKVQE